MYSINTFSVNRLNNAEFVGLMINLGNLIERCEASKMGLDETLVTNFNAKKQQLIDQVRVSAASELTARMNAANDKRIRMFKLANYTLRKTEVDDRGGSMTELCERVGTLILKPYSMAILRLPQQELTTVLSGFIYDMRNKFDSDELEDLGVDREIDNLESANQEFIAAYSARAAQRAEAGSALTQQLRLEMVDLYMSICFTTQYYANSELEANATKAKTCQEFIGVANQILTEAKSRYQQRMNALHGIVTPGEEDENGEGGTQGGGTQGGNTQGGNTHTGGTGGNTQGGNTNTGGTGGNTQGGGNTNTGGTDIDHENGTVHDGGVEF